MLIATQSKHELFTQELNQPILKLDPTTVINTPYLLFEAGPRGGSVINAITITTDDALARLLHIYESTSGYDFHKTTVSLPVSTPYGTDGTNPELDIISNLRGTRIDGAGNRSFYLAPGKSLKVAISVALATSKFMCIRVYGENY
jgi:hypothetical protein